MENSNSAWSPEKWRTANTAQAIRWRMNEAARRGGPSLVGPTKSFQAVVPHTDGSPPRSRLTGSDESQLTQ